MMRALRLPVPRPRCLRGAALTDMFLAGLLLAILMTALVSWLDSRRTLALEDEAGRQVALLGASARQYVKANYDRLAGGLNRIDPTVLKAQRRSMLPQGFRETDAMRRKLRAWYLKQSTPARIIVLAGQVDLPANDERLPFRALMQGKGKGRLGMLRSANCPDSVGACLIGPTIADTLAGFSVDPDDEGAIMALHEVTLDEFCGGHVPRTARAAAACPADMQAPLDMGNHEMTKVRDISPLHELRVERDMEIATGWEIAGNMHVAQKTVVEGSSPGFVVNGGLSVYGNIEAANGLVVEQNLTVGDSAAPEKGTLDVRDNIRAEKDVFVADGVCVRGDVDVDGSLQVGSVSEGVAIDASTGC